MTRALLVRRQRGYTAVELMIAIGVFGIGVSGIIAMQKVTASSNQHAKNLNIATHIAESWLDMLSTDAVTWNQPSSNGGSVPDIGQTTWLQAVKPNANAATDWVLPTYSIPLAFGPAFDALGNPVVNPAAANVVFCTHLRLSWLYQPTLSGNGLIRAEVRVFWLRSGGPGFAQNMCTDAQVANVGGNVQAFHFVQKITAIRENDQ